MSTYPVESTTKNPVYVIGVGMTKFEQPGRSDRNYKQLVKEAVIKALEDAQIDYNMVEQACVGHVYGGPELGHRSMYEIGMTGIPIHNVNNNCATGSTALFLAKQLIEGGVCDCTLAVGFEVMERGALTSKFRDRTHPLDKHIEFLSSKYTIQPAPMTAQLFGAAAREHMEKYKSTAEHFAKIAWKNHKHSVNNPYSLQQREYSLEDILVAKETYHPITKLQCCPVANGAASAILASESFVHKHGLQNQAVEILAMELVTDLPSTFSERSCIKLIGFDMTKKAAETAYKKAGITPTDIDVIELHDCFSPNELITYEALGLCEIGKGAELVETGDNTYGGKYVVNPSGGLISKGHPLGATGIAQCAELTWQLREQAGKRQVSGAKLGLQHNIGLGGAVVVALYKRANNSENSRNNFKSESVIKSLEQKLSYHKHNQDTVGTLSFKILNVPNTETRVWNVEVRNGKYHITEGYAKAPKCMIIANDDEFAEADGNIDDLLANKSVDVEGDIGFALKLLPSNQLVGKL